MQECKDRDPRPLEWKDGEGERERFEKWWLESDWNQMTLTGIGLKCVALDAWNLRQPEIDALKGDIVRYREALMPQEVHLRAHGELQMELGAHQLEIARLTAENERLRKGVETSQLRFDTGLSAFAERNWKVKALLRDVGSYEKQNENIRRLIDKELGVVKWVTYPVFQDEWIDAAPTPPEPINHAGLFKWCHPGDRQEQRWLLMFDDRDRGYSLYEVESDAIRDFNRAEGGGWNCHLFTSVSRVAPTLPEVGPVGWLGVSGHFYTRENNANHDMSGFLPLYTSPPSPADDELRKAAESMLERIEVYRELMQPIILHEAKNLRAALNKGKS